MPGETCGIRCVPPYKQDEVQNASCPEDNTDPTRPIEWQEGRCDLEWEDCEDPLPLPIGYEKSSRGFHCAPGYVGIAQASPMVHCGPWSPCDHSPRLTGCFPLEACRPVRLDDCALDTSQCPEVFLPGSECELPCKAPFVGAPAVAKCGQNIEWQGAYELSNSSCVCPSPVGDFEGYLRNASGWFCDTNNSYTGTAEVICSQPSLCLLEPLLSGCERSGPCAAPLLDRCIYDASSCEGIGISQQCIISCRSPYQGVSTTAFCENPGGVSGLQFTEPLCSVDFCADPPAPPGYQRNASGWFCAEGFHGEARKHCSHDARCEVTTRLSGCQPIERPCRLPDFGCQYDLSDCGGILPGQSCEVRCRAPFAGWPTIAVCPAGNTSQELLLRMPYCDLEDCPDPEPSPGYARMGESFVCTEGFYGLAIAQCVPQTNCSFRLMLSGCMNSTDVALSLTQLSEAPVERDFSPCQAAEICGEPDEGPEGYDQFLGEWRCGTGFTGSAAVACAPRRNCQSTATLSGCVPIEPCLPLIPDGCDLDVSDCRSVLGGDQCEIRCREPYTGPSTFATCPFGNINTSEVLTWTRPKCALTNCPEGLRPRDGYVKDSLLGWICDPNGFQGTASVNCSINAFCAAECVYGGCSPVEVCAPPAADACRLNFTSCVDLLPGRSCVVSCAPPYFGTSTTASCRPRTNRSGPELDFTAPECQCPEVEPAPGYVFDGAWRCAEGFGGEAMKRCQRPLECLDGPELAGCRPLQPCIAPPSPRCPVVDVSNCSEVPPGEACEVFCVALYVGEPFTAQCPAENLERRPVEVETRCELGCPATQQRGYVEGPTGWSCEEGFEGVPVVYCQLAEDCSSRRVFEGCVPEMRPCGAPRVDGCKFDVSDCSMVPPGESCTLRCFGNYSGQPVEAHCPIGNVLDEGLTWERLPRCVAEDFDCPLPAVLPEGYRLIGNDLSCEEGYIGSWVSTRCGHDAECRKVMEFTGCKKPVKCSPLHIEPCERDNLGCWDVEAGSSCSIPCKPPFFGQSVTATCAAGNTDPTTLLDFELVSCLCSDPPAVPDGYVQDFFGGWSCDAEYTGSAERRCRVGEICIPDSELVGCAKLEACALLAPMLCEQDVSDCSSVEPGGTCFVTCRSPWVSVESVVGVCPADNVDPTQMVTWTPPTCELRCPIPPLPPGYEWDSATSTARCEDGYLGLASTTCTIDNETCQVTTTVSGCNRLMPCKLPPVDQCRINITECREVMPGSSCRPRCIPPFELYGPAALASCPENNLDPDTELEWQQFPNCSVFECSDPSPVPAGYAFGVDENNPAALNQAARWYCTTGYVGLAERVCGSNSSCGVIAFLSGCLPIIPCRAPFVDTCRVDDSRCASIRPGGRCTLSCRPPFVGIATVASCSVRNTEPDGLIYRMPVCTLPENFDPLAVDIGFRNTYQGFSCSEGYAGRIRTTCRMQAGCRTTSFPEGCAPPVTCKVAGFQDEDGRRGVLGGNFTFGRAQLDQTLNSGQAVDQRNLETLALEFSGMGTIYEDEVESYDIYFVDSCNELLGDALDMVATRDSTDQILCCDDSVYSVSLINLTIPQDARGLAVVAKIRNMWGHKASVNYWVFPFEDRIDPITSIAVLAMQVPWWILLSALA